MPNFKDHRVKAFLLFALLYWVSALLTIEHLSSLAADQAIKTRQQSLQSDVSISRSKIEAAIYEDIYIADALALMLEYDASVVERSWEKLAQQFLQKASNARNIGVAPDDTIRYIYPLEGNEAALGLNFKNAPHQYAAVEKARLLQSVYLDGPLELVQGGTAIIARYPIFLDRPLNQQYWGTVSVVLDFDKIIENSLLKDIPNAEIALIRDNLSNEQQLVFGDLKAFHNPDVLLPIHLPNTHWQLAAKLHYWQLPEVNKAQNITNLFGFAGASILFLSIYILFRSYRVAHDAATIDDLTQLPNRRFFFAKLAKRIRRAKYDGNFSILNIDVNYFKHINDEFGHEAGDDLLRYLAKHLNSAISEGDLVARMGGDEFVILLNSEHNQQAVDRVISRIDEALLHRPFYWKSNSLSVSLSIGCAIYHGQDEDSLLAEADMKMYQQKQQNKDVSSNADFII